MAKILKNQTVSDIELSDVGVTVPGSGQYVIPTNDYDLFTGSSDTITNMCTGDIVMNDGGNDITILSDAIDILKGFQRGPQGSTGATGATGAQGAQGIQGIQGDTGAQGDQGIQGIQGVQGVQGNAGNDGADGQTVLNGTAVPTTEGVDGDFYIKTDTDDIYGPKSGGVWGSATSLIGPTGSQGIQGNAGADGSNGTNGTNGTDGKTVLNGTAVPTTEGVDGDFYIKTDTSDLYGPKTGGSWGSATSLIGPQGSQGIQGIQGIQGVAGNDGADGEGVPAGGTTNQILEKIDGTDYNTQWVTPAAGGDPTDVELIVPGSTTSTSDTQVLISSATLTPAAGTYRMFFTGIFSNTDATSTSKLVPYIAGVPQTVEDKNITYDHGNQSGLTLPVFLTAKGTVNGSQAFEIFWARAGGTGTMQMAEYQMVLIKVDA